MDYRDFIATKQRTVQAYGFDVEPQRLNRHLMGWQRDAVQWALRRGRAALFEDCGLGKTLQQLAWAEQIVERTGGAVVLHCPVGVRQQTLAEAEKFGIRVPVRVSDRPDPMAGFGIDIVNYEKMHHFDGVQWAGVVLDESSILKNFTGKIKRQLIERYKRTPYRLCCTATPSPNDHMELGNHADFLGIMPSNEMLSRWFINDTMRAGGYRLKKHAQADFWRWVASWAICISKPSDIGGDDDGFDLPSLNVKRHVVRPSETEAPDGFLFNVSGISATNIHEEKRMTLEARVRKAAELEATIDDACVIWCDTNYESDALQDAIPHAAEIRGGDSTNEKERKLSEFASGGIQALITKPSIAGFGMNWQHCNQMIFAGLGFSFESYYQAVRRCWRFGQSRPVTVDIVLADSESSISSAIARKEFDHKLMQTGMANAMRETTLAQLKGELIRDQYHASTPMQLPTFLNGGAVNA